MCSWSEFNWEREGKEKEKKKGRERERERERETFLRTKKLLNVSCRQVKQSLKQKGNSVSWVELSRVRSVLRKWLQLKYPSFLSREVEEESTKRKEKKGKVNRNELQLAAITANGWEKGGWIEWRNFLPPKRTVQVKRERERKRKKLVAVEGEWKESASKRT